MFILKRVSSNLFYVISGRCTGISFFGILASFIHLMKNDQPMESCVNMNQIRSLHTAIVFKKQTVPLFSFFNSPIFLFFFVTRNFWFLVTINDPFLRHTHSGMQYTAPWKVSLLLLFSCACNLVR